jgi:hypothetical protein
MRIILAPALMGLFFALLIVPWIRAPWEPRPAPPPEVMTPVPFEDPPGVTPQRRIDQTWECLRQWRFRKLCD